MSPSSLSSWVPNLDSEAWSNPYKEETNWLELKLQIDKNGVSMQMKSMKLNKLTTTSYNKYTTYTMKLKSY